MPLTPLLNVADVSASLAFYSRFGFQAVERFDEGGTLIWVRLKVGESGLMLNLQDRVDAETRRARPHYGDVVFYIDVPSAEAMRAALVDGVEATRIERQTYGLDEFYVRDPDGYELAIASRVPADG